MQFCLIQFRLMTSSPKASLPNASSPNIANLTRPNQPPTNLTLRGYKLCYELRKNEFVVKMQ